MKIRPVSLIALAMCGFVAAAATGQSHETAPKGQNADVSDDVHWPQYNRTYQGERFSELAEINTGNIGDLAELCRIRVSGPGPFSTSLIEDGGTLFLTSTHATIALDATNCDIKWKSIYAPQATEVFNTHRGVAVAEGLVVRGTTDGYLVAYDRETGQQRWTAKVGDSSKSEFVSSAPLAWNGMVFAGVAGSDWGIQGHMDGFDLATGRKLWSFNVIPSPGEKGNETWPGESWKHGGGGTWTSYTLDPETGELFVPVANPAMSWNGSARRGDNLFSNSVVVLDAKTGKLRWHYQTRKHDTHDYGVTSAPILSTLANGKEIVAVTPKDGYLYAIDRKSHKLLYRVPATTILNHEVEPTPEGIHTCPGIYGGSEWNGPAFEPREQLLMTGQTDWCVTIRQTVPMPVYERGKLYMGGKHEMDEKSGGWVAAFAAGTGKPRWKRRFEAPIVSGITPTAGGLTFMGDMGGTFYALRSKNGEILKAIDTGGAVAGGVITYRLSGKQYVAITSGNISRSSWPQGAGIPSVAIYGLPRSDKSTDSVNGGDVNAGKALYASVCAGCHGVNADGGGGGPALLGVGMRYTHSGLVDFIKNPPATMPKLYPQPLQDADVEDLAAYVERLR